VLAVQPLDFSGRDLVSLPLAEFRDGKPFQQIALRGGRGGRPLGLNMLGQELLSNLCKGGRELIGGPLGCRIGTVGNRAKGFLGQRASFVWRDGASLGQRKTPRAELSEAIAESFVWVGEAEYQDISDDALEDALEVYRRVARRQARRHG
jgi:hypothetical protein